MFCPYFKNSLSKASVWSSPSCVQRILWYYMQCVSFCLYARWLCECIPLPCFGTFRSSDICDLRLMTPLRCRTSAVVIYLCLPFQCMVPLKACRCIEEKYQLRKNLYQCVPINTSLPSVEGRECYWQCGVSLGAVAVSWAYYGSVRFCLAIPHCSIWSLNGCLLQYDGYTGRTFGVMTAGLQAFIEEEFELYTWTPQMAQCFSLSESNRLMQLHSVD